MGIRVRRRTKGDGQVHWLEPPRLLTLAQLLAVTLAAVVCADRTLRARGGISS